MDNKYALGLLGNKNAGGWRFGGASNDVLDNIYTPEAYDQGLMQRAGNPRGVIDKAMEANPVSTAATTGLLGNQEPRQSGVGYGGQREGNQADNSSTGGMDMGMNGMGFGFSTDAAMAGAAKGSAAGLGGMALGGLIGGFYSDPLGKFAKEALQAQTQRDMNEEARKREAAMAQARQFAVDRANWGSSAGLTAQANSMPGDALGNLMGLTNAFGTGGGSFGGGSFGGSNFGGNDSHDGDSSHGTRG